MSTNNSKYFNRFDPKDNYISHSFIADRVLQSSELNEIQSRVSEDVKNLSGYIAGSTFIFNGGNITSLQDGIATISETYIIDNGTTIYVPQTQIKIPTTGEVIIGLRFEDVTVTADMDSNLNEQYPNSPSLGFAGADRIKRKTTWEEKSKIDDVSIRFFSVFTIKDGVVVKITKGQNDLDQMQGLIGRYDNDTNGSYVLSGLNLTFNQILDDGNVELKMSSGRARVLGNECSFSVESNVLLDPISDLRTVDGEPYVYQEGKFNYTLRYAPISAVLYVQGTKQETITLTHGSVLGVADQIPRSPVLKILSVTQGSTTYEEEKDWKLVGDTIDWSPNGAEPSPGSTYEITYYHIETFFTNFTSTDVVLSQDNILVPGSTFYVTYLFYLARIDRINLDSGGNLRITKGVPTLASNIQPPGYSNNLLSLATVNLISGIEPEINMDDRITVVPYSNLKSMQEQIKDLTYNVAILSLKDEVRDSDPTTNKRGIVVDPLVSDALRDQGKENNCVLDTDSKMLKIGTKYASTVIFPTGVGNNATLPFDDYIWMRQENRTKDQRINPYADNESPRQANINVVPSSIDTRSFWSWWHGSYLPQNTKTLLYLDKFTANENIQVWFRDTLTGTGTANKNGSTVYTLNIPAGIQNGTYPIKAVGQSSGAVAQGVFTIFNSGKVDFGWDYTGGERPWGYDPVAQTFFTDDKAIDINAVSVYLTEIPGNTLNIKIVNTTVGIPDRNSVLGLGTLEASKCVIGWNKVPMRFPVPLAPNSEYAIIVSTSTYAGKVGVAKIGEYDSDKSMWITRQPNAGVLLVSANESTWNSIQDEDLMFRLHSPIYKTSFVSILGTAVVAGVSDWTAVGVTDFPSGTSMQLFLVDPTGIEYELMLNGSTYTKAITGTVTFKVKMSTTNTFNTPKLLNGITIGYGNPDAPATYTQRAFNIINGVISPVTLILYLDQYKPVNSSIIPKYLSTSDTWINFVEGKSTPAGDGWTTTQYTAKNVALLQSQLRIAMSTTTGQNRPFIKNIRLILG